MMPCGIIGTKVMPVATQPVFDLSSLEEMIVRTVGDEVKTALPKCGVKPDVDCYLTSFLSL